MIRRASILALLGALIAGGCGDNPTTPDVTVTIQPPASAELMVGDELTLTASVSQPGAVIQWVPSDTAVAAVVAGVVEGLRPGGVWVSARAGGAADSVFLTVIPRPDGYSAQEVDYFLEIAFGVEYGQASLVVRRWRTDALLRVNGTPSHRDLETLSAVVEDINELTATADMVIVEEDASVELHFAPSATFPEILPGYVPGNLGYFSVWWDATQHFTRAVVLIATEIDQPLRDHLIREEVTQILGLMRDSFRFPDSIFYQQFSLTHEFAPVDAALIEMLYRPEIDAGMAQGTAARVLRRLVRNGEGAGAPVVAASQVPTPIQGIAGWGSGGSRPPPLREEVESRGRADRVSGSTLPTRGVGAGRVRWHGV
jgi:hypothetical protein